jgi:hypothetical protein
MNKNVNDVRGFFSFHAIYPKGDCHARKKII